MKFVCEGVDLSDAVIKVVKACAGKAVNPIMECIKLEARNDVLQLTATDGEISIQKSIKAEIMEEGETCVNGKYFSDYIKKLEGCEIMITVDKNIMELSYADSKTAILCLSASDFPAVDTEIAGDSIKIKTDEFKKLVSKTIFCSATDESRPILKGCEIKVSGNQVNITAIDGYRLATVTCDIESATGDFSFICPARTLNEIERMLPSGEGETELRLQKGILLVCVEDAVVTSRLYSGEYLKKNNIIPENFVTTVTTDRRELVSSLERASIIMRMDKNSLITLDIFGDKIYLTAVSDVGAVNEIIPCTLEGKDIKISLNSKFLLDAMNALDEDEIVLSFNSQVTPFIAQNKNNKNSLYLILPVKTN